MAYSVKVQDYTVHLGSHDFGLEGQEFGGPEDHKLSAPTVGVGGLDLPFISFAAINQETAEKFIKILNFLAAQYQIEALDLARLVQAADELTGD